MSLIHSYRRISNAGPLTELWLSPIPRPLVPLSNSTFVSPLAKQILQYLVKFLSQSSASGQPDFLVFSELGLSGTEMVFDVAEQSVLTVADGSGGDGSANSNTNAKIP